MLDTGREAMRAAGGPAGVPALLLAATGCGLYPGCYGLEWEEPISDISKQLSQQHPEWTNCSSHLQLCAEEVVHGLISPEKDPGHCIPDASLMGFLTERIEKHERKGKLPRESTLYRNMLNAINETEQPSLFQQTVLASSKICSLRT